MLRDSSPETRVNLMPGEPDVSSVPMSTSRTAAWSFTCLFLAAAPLCAAVKLPAILAEHMVLQQNRPVHLWGLADPGEAVTATFRGQSASITASEQGTWSLYLPPGAAGGPFALVVSGTNTIEFHDVLVGEVWIASGQSNMEFTTRDVIDAEKELQTALHPQLRLFNVDRNVAFYPRGDLAATGWQPAAPETVRDFSAVAYFFGRHLLDKLHVPVGLIDSTWGGTPAEAWTSLDALSSDASLMPVFSAWATTVKGFSAADRGRELAEAENARAKAEGRQPKPLPWSPNQRLSWSPAGLYNAMIAPLTPFPIRGAIWYQGESNAGPDRVALYGRLFQALISDWRRQWADPDLPFLFVQLASFNTKDDWPLLREKQIEALSLRNTGMAVTIDIGNPADIHPKNKQDVGLRLAIAARAIAYGEHIEYSGPVFQRAEPAGASMVVYFDHAGGLAAKSGTLQGFEVAGADGKYSPATATIEGTAVRVSSPSVAQPLHVRYAWACAPVEANLVNGDGLPASPFRSSRR
jgi:sialate O-acetylesterase